MLLAWNFLCLVHFTFCLRSPTNENIPSVPRSNEALIGCSVPGFCFVLFSLAECNHKAWQITIVLLYFLTYGSICLVSGGSPVRPDIKNEAKLN